MYHFNLGDRNCDAEAFVFFSRKVITVDARGCFRNDYESPTILNSHFDNMQFSQSFSRKEKKRGTWGWFYINRARSRAIDQSRSLFHNYFSIAKKTMTVTHRFLAIARLYNVEAILIENTRYAFAPSCGWNWLAILVWTIGARNQMARNVAIASILSNLTGRDHMNIELDRYLRYMSSGLYLATGEQLIPTTAFTNHLTW